MSAVYFNVKYLRFVSFILLFNAPCAGSDIV